VWEYINVPVTVMIKLPSAGAVTSMDCKVSGELDAVADTLIQSDLASFEAAAWARACVAKLPVSMSVVARTNARNFMAVSFSNSCPV
jgi:hypothetical protein